ncbi:MAG TPA: acyl carrier protein [Candidatus Dormibacteraeota bacterium]|nr:acyl carrier protein [Candidatus Dormibacteraeota bacterium]
MPDPVRDRAAVHLETALGRPVDLSELTDDTPLNTLGLDSLLTISALVGLSEDYGVDLAEYADTLAAPSTVGDLVAIATRFMRDRD